MIVDWDERVQVIPLYTPSLDLVDLKRLIINKMEHKFLKKYFKNPIIDEEKLAILAMVIDQTDLSKENKQQLIISSTLIQIAIDVHDLVPVETTQEESELDITLRQLSVLSGDYYSGLYYFLLAEMEDIGMIHAVATAVKEVSEYKMKLYYKEFSTLEDYIDMVKKAESFIIVTIAEYFGLHVLSNWIKDLIFTAKLRKEFDQLHTQSPTPLIDKWPYSSVRNNSEQLLSEVEEIIRAHTAGIEAVLLKPTEELFVFEAQMRYLLDKLIYDVTSVLEEG